MHCAPSARAKWRELTFQLGKRLNVIDAGRWYVVSLALYGRKRLLLREEVVLASVMDRDGQTWAMRISRGSIVNGQNSHRVGPNVQFITT